MAKEDKITKIKCPLCDKEKPIREFYKSNSPRYKIHRERSPYCKKCLSNYIYNKKTGLVDRENFRYVLKEYLDKPFYQDVYIVSVTDEKNTLGTYLRNLSIVRKAGKQTWEDGETEDIEEEKENIDNDINVDKFDVTKEMMKRWGKGYKNEDYQFLEDTYHEWTTRYKCDTLAEEKTYQFLTLKELEIRKARENGDNVDKLEETFRKLMMDANVTPREANASNDPENLNSLGVWIKDIERYRPAEYFEDKKIYQDFDKLREYLNRFVFRPLKNLLTGTRDFDKEFNVETDKNKIDLEDKEE